MVTTTLNRTVGSATAAAAIAYEAAEPEHGDEAVRGRFRDPELGRRVAHPQQPVPLQHQQQLKHVIDGLHWIGRRSWVPHHRTISK